MASVAARLASAYLRRRIKARLAAAPDLAAAAEIMALPLRAFPAIGGERRRIGGVEGVFVSAKGAAAGATLLYLHGGAYFALSPQLYGSVLRAFADHGFDLFAPAYRLAPERPFPAALEDALAVYAALRGESDLPIVVAGDSAGGGLALALMLAMRDAGHALPAAAALFSPWTDLAATGASAREKEQSDALFSRRMLKIAARAYLGGANARTPLASPLYADLSGLPPLLIHASEDEILRDDSTRLVERARMVGVEAQLKLWPIVPHGWQLAAAFMPEARQSISEAAGFLLRVAA